MIYQVVIAHEYILDYMRLFCSKRNLVHIMISWELKSWYWRCASLKFGHHCGCRCPGTMVYRYNGCIMKQSHCETFNGKGLFQWLSILALPWRLVIWTSSKLEQLEYLCSEDTPRRFMITRTIESYWIPSQKMMKSKLQIERICQNFKFQNFETNITRDTPSEVAW